MQVWLAKADAYLFDKFADQAALIFIESSQLLKQVRINLNL